MRKLKLFLDAKAANTPPRGISRASRVIFSVLTLLLLSVGQMWATQQSYTIELKPSGINSNNALTASNFVTSCVTSGGTYISSCASTAKVFTNGGFVKLGSSGDVGNFTLNLSEAGQVKATSIVVSAKQYSSSEKTLKITCSADATGVSFTDLGSSFTDKTLSLDGETTITSITVTTTTKRGYVESVTVYYDDGQGGNTPPTPSKTDVTDEQLAWSANQAVVTIGATNNVFPELTNTLNLAVTYQSTAEAVATIDANGVITLVKAGTTTIKAIFDGDDDYNAKTISYTLTVNPAPLTPIAGGVIDVLTGTWTGVGGTGYNDVDEDAPTSDAHYVGNCASNKGAYIQLRTSNSKEGIVSSVSGGKVKRVEVVWNSSTSAGRTLDVYGSNTEYTAATELYGSSPKGTKIGSIVCGTSTYFDVEGDYAYVGFRSSNGAMYMDEVRITWIPATKYAVNIASVTNGTLVVKNGTDEITSGDEFVEGKTLTVLATPNDGFKLDGIKVIETGSDPENDVTSTVLAGTTLTVPAYAITVSATFSANEAPFATLTLSEIGEETVYYDDDSKREGDIVSLPLTAASCSKVFVGWDPNVDCATEPTYAPGADFTLGASASNKLYAVYATPVIDTESDPELAQTHVMGTWTIGGSYSTTVSTSYVLFGNGGYVESDEFDLATLAKVKVFGGTYGGADTYKDLTINDGTDKWLDGELTGTGNAKEHVFTGGAALTGSGKLYIKSTCGNGSNSGLRISKVEIYTYGTTYGEYSTECMAKVDAPTFPVEQKEYTAAQNITISAVTGATIHYTTDGSIPTSTSATYSEPIALSARGEYVIKAIAVKDGFANSDVAVAHYSINLPFANLSDLVEANLADGSEVIVSFADEVITNKGSKYIYLTTKDANNNSVEIYYGSANIPEGWVVGGKVAATAKRFTWKLFGETQWELIPVGEFAWATDLAYTAPKTVSSVVVTGEPTKKVYTVGETFDPAGLTVTVNYSDATSETNPAVGVTFTTDPENGKMALEQTSIKVKATYNTVTSEEWFTVSGLTVNDLETKTVAEFIAAEGGRCYLVGTVSNITNTQYGNFDLTDASGTIYVYGCLDIEGASKNFASLDVVEDDYIKVIADVYEYYNNETHEAKNVQFVAELPKPVISVTSVSVANATVKINKTVQLTETVLPINASNKSVTWSVKAGSEAIAEVNETTGVVTGLSEGEAVIIATSVADNTKFGECTVTVTGGINFAAGDFVLVEDAAELTEGTYVIVADAGTTYNVAMKYLEGTDKIHKSTAAVKEGKFLHYNSEFGVYQIKNYVVSEEVVGLSFLNEDAENYLALPSASNELRVSATQDANSAWTVSISDGEATIANKALTARKIRYNSGSPRFACYESGQKAIALYKYVTPAAYRVYYNDNVAEEEIEVPAYQSVDGENKVTISAVEPVRDGYLFDGWKDGEANVYEAGVEYMLSGDITLYAQWKTAVVSTLSYNPNGGTLIGGETAIADAEVAEGTNLTIEANVYEKGDNFVFAGWQLGDDVYQPGDPFVMPATDVEFVAKWDAVEVSDYALVTDVAQLQAGDKIIIVAADYNVAAGSQAATYRNPVTIGKTASKNNLILNELAMPTEFVLGIADGKFSFNDGAGYMYENGEKSVKVQDDPYYWTISIDAEAIATITGTNPLLYNSNNNQERFTTYTSEQKVLQLYRKPGDAPVYTTVRTDLNEGEYYTMCLKNKVTAVQGGSIWRVLSKAANDKDIILEEVTGNLDAGRPYIFRATADKLEVACTGVVANAPITTGNNGLIGSYTQVKIDQSENNYIIYNNALYFVNSDNVYVGANRAYLDMTGVPDYNSNEPQQGNAPRRRVTMTVYNEQTTTDIDALNASETTVKVIIEGKLYIIRGEKMFNANGQLVK